MRTLKNWKTLRKFFLCFFPQNEDKSQLMCLKIYASPPICRFSKTDHSYNAQICASSIMLFFLKRIQKIKNHKQIEKGNYSLVNAYLLDFISKYLNFYTAILFHVNNPGHHRNVAVHDITNFISLSGSKIQKGFA